MGLLSDECDRGGPGACGAAQLREGEDEGELTDAVARELGQVEVLDDEDAALDVEALRHLERPLRVLRRYGPVAPGVRAGEGDALLGQPLSELEARARLPVQV